MSSAAVLRLLSGDAGAIVVLFCPFMEAIDITCLFGLLFRDCDGKLPLLLGDRDL